LRRWLPSASFSALIVGSLTPDVGYFLPLGVRRIESHTPWAIVWFCVPCGVVLWLAFQFVLKRPLILLAPDVLRSRLIGFVSAPRLSELAALSTVLSVALGALTHVVWDAFTHANGQAVTLLPVLRAPLISVAGASLPAYKLLQHGSTAGGLLALGYVAWGWLRRTPASTVNPAGLPSERARRVLWGGLFGVAAVVGIATSLWRLDAEAGLDRLPALIGRAFVNGTACVSLLLFGLALWGRVRGDR
jgi:hypothetical protein